MFRKTSLFVSFLLLAMSVLFTACAPNRSAVDSKASESATGSASASSSAGASPSASAAAEAKPEQLVIWANNDPNQLKALQQITEKYTQNTGIKVVIEPVNTPDQIQKLALAAPAGKGPDLFYQPQDRLGDVVTQGLVTPIKLKPDSASGYSQPAIEAVTFDGQIYGAPSVIETYVLYYNTDLVKTPPATIDDVAVIGKPITDPSKDKFGFLMSPDFYYMFSFMKSYGGYIFGGKPGSYDVSDIGLGNDGALQGMIKFQEFYKQNSLPKTLSVDVLDSLFMDGKAGMVVSGPWAMATYSKPLGDKLRTAPLPKVNNQPYSSFVGVKSWFVSSYSKSPEWASDLALFMTNDENSKLYFDGAGELPPRPAILDQIKEPLYAGFIEQIKNGMVMPNIPEMTPVWDMDKALDLIVQGQDVKSVLEETVNNIKQKISSSGK